MCLEKKGVCGGGGGGGGVKRYIFKMIGFCFLFFVVVSFFVRRGGVNRKL